MQRSLHAARRTSWRAPTAAAAARTAAARVAAYSSSAPPPLTAPDLARAARVARLAGAAYHADDASLQRALDRAAGDGDGDVTLIAAGSTFFTRWFVADLAEPAGRTRVVAARGVTWLATPGASTTRLWSALARAWPAPLTAGGRVRAHAGVADLSAALLADVAPHVRSSPLPVLFTGHSLGGALALACAARLADGERGGLQHPPRVVTFGAPPTLCPSPPDDPLAAVGLSRSVTSFVSAGDPVPRWMEPVSAVPGVAAALRALSGGGAPATLFTTVGDTHLITWSPDAGVSVTPLPRATADAALAAAAPTAGDADGGVRRALGFLLDHAHTSYADDLAAAANASKRGRAAAV